MAKSKRMSKKEKQKQKERRLLLILFLLIGTGVFLGTASYAWFTANEKVTISPIDVNVSTSSGIQISTDATNWKSVITNTDITGAISNYSAAVNQLPETLEPVSTAGVVDSNGKMEMFLGKVLANESTGDFILSATKSNETNSSGSTSTGKFVAFDIFLKNEQNETLYMTPNSTVEYRNSDSGIKNATRVAFVTLGHTTTSDTIANIQALNNGTSSVVKIWEPNYDVHTANGVANAISPYGITTLNTGANNAWVPYSGVSAEVPSSANIKREQATQAANASYFTSFAYDSTANPAQTIAYDVSGTNSVNYFVTKEGYTTSQLLTATDGLTAGVTKMRIYMWVEGQDVDCENNASGGEIRFNLQFSIKPVDITPTEP